MAPQPLVFALANPNPEITPEDVKAVRSDAIIATGRTDYPNQVNNVLCFPYIFRERSTAVPPTITTEMEIASVHAIAALAQAEQSEVVAQAYVGEQLSFGPEYLIPKPFDPRLMMKIAPAVAQAAQESGVAQRPIADMDAYRDHLQTLSMPPGTTMKPIFMVAKQAAKSAWPIPRARKSACCAQRKLWSMKKIARPTLIGRPSVIAQRCENSACACKKGATTTW